MRWALALGVLLLFGGLAFAIGRLDRLLVTLPGGKEEVEAITITETPTEPAVEAPTMSVPEISTEAAPLGNPLVEAMATQLAVLQKFVEDLGSAQPAETEAVLVEAPEDELEEEPVVLDEIDLGDALSLDGFVRTGRSLKLTLANGTEISLGENTVFRFGESGEDPNASEMRLTLSQGEMWINLRGGKLAVKTPAGIATVEGSMLGISYSSEDNSIDATCMEGTVTLITGGEGEALVVPPGEQAKSAASGEAPAATSAMPTEKLVGWAMNVSDSIEVMTDAEIVPQDAFVDMAASLPIDDERGQEALGTVVEVVDTETLVNVVENVPAESLGVAIAVIDERDSKSQKFDEVMDLIPDETLGGVIAGVATRGESEQALVRFVDDLSDVRLQNMTLDAPPDALGAVIVAMDIVDPASIKFEQIVGFVPDEALGELVAGAADMDDNKRAMARFVSNLSDDRLETMALDTPEDALGEMIVAMTTFGTETHEVSDVLDFVSQEKMIGMIESMAATPKMDDRLDRPGLTGPIPAPGQAFDPMAAVNEAVTEMWIFMPEEWHEGIMADLEPEALGFVGGSLAFDDAAGGGSLLGDFMQIMPDEKLGGALDAIAGGEGGDAVIGDVIEYLDSEDLVDYFEHTQDAPGGGEAFEAIREFVPEEILENVFEVMPEFSDLDDLEESFVPPPEIPAEGGFFEGTDDDDFFAPVPENGGFGPDAPPGFEGKPDGPPEGELREREDPLIARPERPDEPGTGPPGRPEGPRPDKPDTGPPDDFGSLPPDDFGSLPLEDPVIKPPEEPYVPPEEPVYVPPEEPVYVPPPEEIATERPEFEEEFKEEFPGTQVP